MSLFSSIHMASNTLRANQIAMQVVGQNIANANTPGYIREDVLFTPGPTQQVGGLLLGSGVSVDAVIQRIDTFLEDRLRGSVSDRASSDTQEEIYMQLEGLIGELSDTDLSTSMNNFFSSISEVLNQPESASVRNLAVLQGGALADDVNRLAGKVLQLRRDVDDRVRDGGERINDLLDQIRALNVRIAQTECGDISQSDAVGLRDQRLDAIEQLSQLINIRVEEQDSGWANIYVGGEFLLHDGLVRHVKVALDTDHGLTVGDIRLAQTDSPLMITSGEIFGLVAARDDILAGFQDQLDDFASTLAFEFNKVYSGGQGLSGFQQLTSEWGVDASNVPLDQAGLPFTPSNGSLQVIVTNTLTGTSQTTDVQVDLNHLGNDTSLDDLAAALDAVDGISAKVLTTGKLSISSDSADHEFSFANDTSGALAALGLNVFFTGSDAASLGTSDILKQDPAKFAASRGGVGLDVDNAVDLADFLDRPLAAKENASIGVLYDRLVSDATQGSTVARAVAEGNRGFEQTLRAQKTATSGVSLDEETVRLIGFQQAYQASARYISVLQELFKTLVAM